MLIYVKEIKDEMTKQMNDVLTPLTNRVTNIETNLNNHKTDFNNHVNQYNSLKTTVENINDDYLSKSQGGTVSADVTFNSHVTFGHYARSFTCSSPAFINNRLSVGGGATFNDTITAITAKFSGSLTVAKTLNVSGVATFSSGVSGSGNISGFSKVYNAVWNDYAEFFERGADTEPGDIVAIDLESENECYVLADRKLHPNMIVGVHSDTYGHLIGGEQAPNYADYAAYNMPKFIPVGLSGRVKVKCLGCVNRGDVIVLSHIPGVGRVWQSPEDDPFKVGIACQDKHSNEMERVKIFIKY